MKFRSIHKLTALERAAIRNDYEKPEPRLSLNQMVEKYGVSRDAIFILRDWENWEPRRNRAVVPRMPRPAGIRGRSSIYNPVLHPIQIYELSLLGLTWKKISEIMGIPERTLQDWAADDRKPEFQNAMHDGRDGADSAVVKSVLQRIVGFTVPDVKIFQHDGAVIEHKYMRYYPPDGKLGMTWLSRRRPDHWSETRNLNVSDRTLRTEVPAQPPVTDDSEFRKLVDVERNG